MQLTSKPSPRRTLPPEEPAAAAKKKTTPLVSHQARPRPEAKQGSAWARRRTSFPTRLWVNDTLCSPRPTPKSLSPGTAGAVESRESRRDDVRSRTDTPKASPSQRREWGTNQRQNEPEDSPTYSSHHPLILKRWMYRLASRNPASFFFAASKH
jgi:hypothetical protein